MRSSSEGVDVVVLTALAEEKAAVVAAAGEADGVAVRGSGDDAFVATLGPLRVAAVSLLGMGNVGASAAAQEVIDAWRPKYLVLVGIAGGIRGHATDLEVGDVLVADQVVGYELAKLTPVGPQRRYQSFRPHFDLLVTAHGVADSGWVPPITSPWPGLRAPRIHFGTVLSGEKVFADIASVQEIGRAWPAAVGVEMEGLGVAMASYRAGCGFLLVKGISDLADASKDDRWRGYAAQAAARFALEVLRRHAATLSSVRARQPVTEDAANLQRRQPRSTGVLPRPAECDPLRLGVHPAIPLVDRRTEHRLRTHMQSVSGADQEPHSHQPIPATDAQLPMWVERHLAADLRDWLGGARVHGGFLLILGDSSVGKTRLAYELARQVLPDFALLHPDSTDVLADLAAAGLVAPRLLVWLDELQRYLQGPYLRGALPLTVPLIRRLLDGPTPVVIIGTAWPEMTLPLAEATYLTADGVAVPRYPHAKGVLTFPGLHRVTLSTMDRQERRRAGELTQRDPRLAAALGDPDFGVTEVLAGGPALVARWATSPPATRALITAAIDARRLGIDQPMTEALLSALGRTCLPRPALDDSWFPEALAMATQVRLDDGATAPLLPVADLDNRTTVGYTVADYLLQHGQNVRSTVVPPLGFWRAASTHVVDPDDLARLADSAGDRGLLPIAEQFWRAAIAAGHPSTRRTFAHTLEAQGRDSEAEQILRDAVVAGEPHTRIELAHRWKEQGRFAEVEQLWREGIAADSSNWHGLAGFLAEQKRFIEAEQLANDAILAGDPGARTALGWLLEEQDRLDEAEQVLRQAATEDPDGVKGLAWRRLAGVLARIDRLDEAENMLREAIAAGAPDAPRWLAGILEKHGRHNDAEQILRHNLANNEPFGRSALFEFLQRQGRDDEAEQLGRDGVAAGDHFVRYDLIELLESQERYDEALEILQDAITDGRAGAWRQLTELLDKMGRLDEAELLRRNGLNPDGSIRDSAPYT